ALSKQFHSLRLSSESSEFDGTKELRSNCAKSDCTNESPSVIRIATEQKLIGGDQSRERGNTSDAKKKKAKYVQKIFFANKTSSRSRSRTPPKKKHFPSTRDVPSNDANETYPVSAKKTNHEPQANSVAGANEQTQAQSKNGKVSHKLGLDNLRKPANRSEKRMRKHLKKQYRRQLNQKDGNYVGHSIGCLPSGGDKPSKDTTMTNIPTHGGLIFGKYTDNIDMVHCDFDVHQFEQLNRVAFNWRDHAYSLLQRFCPFVIDHIDRCFSTAWTMANSTTTRKYSEPTSSSTYLAIWNCVQAFYGIHDDSYDYKNVNISMRPQLKRFLKKIVCYPQSVTLHDIDRLGIPLEDHERIHIAILAIEAKKQASLIYGLRAVMRYVVSTG
ncbi:sestrin-like protein, partial [Reticulomyxa filosa]